MPIHPAINPVIKLIKRSNRSANATKLITNAMMINTNLPAANTESQGMRRMVDVQLHCF